MTGRPYRWRACACARTGARVRRGFGVRVAGRLHPGRRRCARRRPAGRAPPAGWPGTPVTPAAETPEPMTFANIRRTLWLHASFRPDAPHPRVYSVRPTTVPSAHHEQPVGTIPRISMLLHTIDRFPQDSCPIEMSRNRYE